VRSDIIQAGRRLRRAPAFAAAAVIMLALGVGANTGAFSAVNTLLLKALPYPEPARLVALHETTADGKPRGVAEANLLDWRARTRSFVAMAVYQPRSFGLTRGSGDAVTVIQTGMVMAEFFRVLAVQPAIGRTFTEEEEVSESRRIVLGDRLWRAMFAADPAVIGRQVALNEEPFTVIGVMPPGFDFPIGQVLPDAFIPLSRRDYCCGRLGQQESIARLAPGVTLDRARSELKATAAGLAREYPLTNAGRSAGMEPLDAYLKSDRRDPLLLLVGASLLLLAIACANVAGLVLARAVARSQEAAVRISLGATFGRLLSQYLAESLFLTGAGALCGLAAASFVLRLAALLVPGASTAPPLRLDGGAFAFALALAVALGVVLAALPAIVARRSDLHSLIKAGAHQTTGRGRLRGTLVVAQIALSTVLLLSAGLLLRSFFAVAATSPGFVPEHALKFGIGLPEKRYDTERKLIDFHRGLLEELGQLPGVEAAGGAQRLPLRGGPAGVGGSFQIYGAGIPIPRRPRSWVNVVSPGYLRAMGTPLLEGREFSWQDDQPGRHRVAIVNQTFVRTYLQGRRPIGTALDIRWVSDLNPLGVPWEIVGVSADTRQANLDHEPLPEILLSMTQIGADGAVYAIRSRGDDGALPRAIGAAVARLDPQLEQIRVAPLSGIVTSNLEPRRAAIRLVAGFGVLALLLAAVGIYGIVSFRAAERSREMAIRVALGASGSEVRGLVLGYALRMAALGGVLGIGGFALALPLLRSQIYGVAAADPVSIAAVMAMILASTLTAALLPARRAARSAPADLLRDS
jgi:putative ABC transport system permease protein